MTFSEPKRLTHYNVQFNSVVFSPDSRYIAFSGVVRRRCHVGLMEATGTGSIVLAGRDNAIDDAYYDLQFSPDGTFLIAYFAEEDGEFGDVCRIDIKTRQQTRLTHTRKIMRPCLSPNGRDIVYEEPKNGTRHLFRVSVDGGEPICLTNAPAHGSANISIYTYPRYSPDGSRISFVGRERQGRDAEPKPPRQIFVMDADGSNLSRLTDVPNHCDYPLWHPDNKRVLFTMQTDFVGDEKEAHKLWKYRTNFHIVDASTGKEAMPRCLETSRSVNWLDSLHPSGRWIAYHSSCGERFNEGWRNWDIRVLDIETGTTLVVTDDDIYDTNPLFSPDGKSFLFVSERENEKRHSGSGGVEEGVRGSGLYLVDIW